MEVLCMVIESVTNKEVPYHGGTTQKKRVADYSANVEGLKVLEVTSDENDRNQQGKQDFELMIASKKGVEQNLQIKKAVDEINKSIQGQQTEAIYGIHDDTNRVTIKIIDKKSKEVIKEFPPEQTLDMIAKVWEMAGIMVDEKG